MALLHLLAGWRSNGGPEVLAATVDHGLRPEARDEAQMVARVSAGLGIAHTTLRWQGWDGRGNLPDAARRARYLLMSQWAQQHEIGCVALAHTADDQAETFLMRLARGSGVDGLSPMAPRRRVEGIDWLRPLLPARRQDLRDYLGGIGAGWVEDPSNEDEDFQRVQARKALAVLSPLGITTEGLIETAHRMGLARAALSQAAGALARTAVQLEAGDVVIAREPFMVAALETRARLLAHGLMWVASADYRPRWSALTACLGEIGRSRQMSLHGCLILTARGNIRILREPAAVAGVEATAGQHWDRRWRLDGPGAGAATIRALGEAGLAQCPDWRATGLPRASLLASPAAWNGPHLVAAPLAGRANGWVACLLRPDDEFFTSLIMH
jgi:tRNA(Ile)-lysidine synthase